MTERDLPERDVPERDLPALDAGAGDGPVLDVFAGMPTGDTHALAARFATLAREANLVDVAYRTVDTRLGTLLVAATERGLVSITFDGADPDATLERLAANLSPRVVHDVRRLDTAAAGIDALTEGRARTFAGALDFALAIGFRADVVHALQRIPYGETRSYGDVATLVGSPRAVRAVGTACRLNPLPIVVPCHRVVRSDGSLGQYAGGADAKRVLLDTEAAVTGGS